MNSLREINKEILSSGEGPPKPDTLHACLSIRKNQLKNNEIDQNSFSDHMDFVRKSG